MIKLVKHVLGILFILAFSFDCFSQQPVPVPLRRYRPVYVNPRQPGARIGPVATPGRRLESVKESYIGRQLNLTRPQARAFWPLYRQYVQDMTAVRIMRRQNNSPNAPNGSVQLQKDLEYETELVNIRKHYLDEFLRILPPEKISQLYKAEKEFNDEMVRQLSERSIRAGN
ncbi:hypothetical protein [Mucilaginibacter gotjawali]|uniref:Uncharacterized protein n=2 Tax=Mucilaginibacter gotjawali TaxID=1550579 RepID=A0A110B1R0_9SPHI|nr:hypothetical protein [Mucilaginibacter gotjawali]MBB3055624.1 hypothetical protein [Mucilaginibacter gotjawali]BAU53091.1 hypothetical protein MgSA37_01258 [Mucilaginibacter gotjawali]